MGGKAAALGMAMTMVLSLLASSTGSAGGPQPDGSRPAAGLPGWAGMCVSGLRLRGGAIDSETLLAKDAILREEVERDITRAFQGKLPMFMERMGEKNRGLYEFEDGVEAEMPPPIGAVSMLTEGPTARQEFEEPVNEDEHFDWVGNETKAHIEERHTREAEKAKKYFASIDAKYFLDGKEEDDEDLWGGDGLWQQRELPQDDLESYFEARKEVAEVERFYRSIPENLEAGSPEFHKWLDDWGWNDMIHRNGTRFKWTPDFMASNEPAAPITEWEEQEYVLRDWEWFRSTTVRLIDEAYCLPKGSNYWWHFRKMNSTFDELARMHTLLNDTVVLDLQDELIEEAGGDEEKQHVMDEFWGLCLQKWKEFHDGPEYDPEMVKVLDDVEKERFEKFGPPEYTKFWSEPREVIWEDNNEGY